MKNVRQILNNKGYDIYSISSDAKVFDALKIMAEKDVGALLVTDEGKVNGIFSERDYARKVVLKGKSSKETEIKEVMSSRVIYVKPSMNADECMALLLNKRIRHLPVFENNTIIGLISIGDVVKAVIEDKEILINDLEEYIITRR